MAVEPDIQLEELEVIPKISEMGKDVELDPVLLESIGLDVAQLELSSSISTSEPDLGNLSLGGEEAGHTELKLHEQGWVQLGAMGVAVGLATIFVGTFLAQSFGLGGEKERENVASKDAIADTGAAERGFISPEEKKDAELSRLQAERAVIDQQYQSRLLEIQRQQQAQAQVQANAASEAAREAEAKAATSALPPPPVVEVPPPTQAPLVIPEPPDLRSQWQVAQEMWALQQQFGSFSGKERGNPLRTELSSRPDVPVETVTPRSNGLPDEPSSPSPSPQAPSSGVTANQSLLSEQQAFLAGKTYDLMSAPVQVASAKINAGTQIEGYVKTPIIFIEGDKEAANRSFTIELTQGLDLGVMKLPAGSYLLGEVSTVAPNGVMFLTGSVIVTPEGELELPEGIVEIRGHQGKPLMANLLQRGQVGEVAKGLGAMFVGAAREAANLFNRPDQQTIVTESQTIVTTQQPEKNYVAAAVSGAFTEITPRVQQALRPAAQNPARVWQVPAGRQVNVFFRRSLTMDMAQS